MQGEQIMENNKNAEIIAKLEEGVKSVFTSDRFQQYLDFSSKFYHYSYCNQILILMQKPDSSYVAGFHKWNELNRHVKKGEHGIKILAPCISHKTVVDDITGDEKIESYCNYFRPVTVFDISQTEGEDIPTLCEELKGSVENADELIAKISSATDFTVEFSAIDGEAYGYCSYGSKSIVVRDDIDELQAVKTLIHEVAHSLLKDTDETDKNSRSAREVEAESVAYIVSQHLGLDTNEYSFEYIASWSEGKDIQQLKSLLGNIQTVVQTILEKL